MPKREATDFEARALERLGVDSKAPPDLAQLSRLYRAWCLNVPFDNVRKMTALGTGALGLLPGTFSEDFLSSWLDHGSGGTCWPSSNGLFALVTACGFEAVRATGSMFATGLDNHGTVIAQIDGTDWMVDSSMLTMAPLPLVQGEVFIADDPLFQAEVDPVDEGFYVWWAAPPFPSMIPCNLLARDVPESLYSANFERSREMSPFNQRLFARRNLPGRILVLTGSRFIQVSASAVVTEDLTAEQLLKTMTSRFGYSKELVEQWAASGGLKASTAPHEQREMPPVERVPPSKRP